MQFWTRSSAWLAAVERADAAAIDDHIHHGEVIAARIPHATIRWTLMYQQAWIAGMRGDLTEYERLIEAALAFGTENGEPDAFTVYASQLANVRYHQGRMHELIPLMKQSLADTPTLHVYRAVLASAHAGAGQIDEAQVITREEYAAGFPMPDDVTWSIGMASWAAAAAFACDLDAAQVLRERLLPYHDQIVTTTTGAVPAVSHYLGWLDHVGRRYNDAERWFTEALELHQQVRSPLFVAYTEAAWAAMLVDRNQDDDHTRARTMAEAALGAAIGGGYGYVENDARAVLDRLS
jgi:tetratricopeptide (TPR) repeat protein